jgi:hypothetical protein
MIVFVRFTEMVMPPPPISQREMRERTKAKVQRLPEVQSKAAMEASRRERELNRIMAKLYKEVSFCKI